MAIVKDKVNRPYKKTVAFPRKLHFSKMPAVNEVKAVIFKAL
jgi:hypothetical protein